MLDITNTETNGQGQAPVDDMTGNNNTGAGSNTGAGEAPEDDFDLGQFQFDNLDDDATPAPGGGEGGQGQQQQVPEDYAFDLGAETEIPEELHAPYAAAAKELGLDGQKAAGLLNKALSIAQERALAADKAAGRELKQEWGAEYEQRKGDTMAFMKRMAKSAGLSAEQMKLMMSPNGFRLMDAMRRSVSENSRLAGGNGIATHVPTVQERIDAIYNDPVKYAALINPADPQWKAVNDELNRLMGIRG